VHAPAGRGTELARRSAARRGRWPPDGDPPAAAWLVARRRDL